MSENPSVAELFEDMKNSYDVFMNAANKIIEKHKQIEQRKICCHVCRKEINPNRRHHEIRELVIDEPESGIDEYTFVICPNCMNKITKYAIVTLREGKE